MLTTLFGKLSTYRLDKEWQVIDLATQAYKKVSVSLYDTLGQDSVGTLSKHV
jgi:long-subunit acyl-CoA synthetase (AMP-forming)